MNKFLSFVMLLAVTLFTANAFAWTPPPAPSDGSYVVDLAGKLSASQKAQLNQRIEQVNRTTANEFGVLLVPDMGGSSIEDVANSTYKAWGIGKKGLDNGCLIVVAIKERKSRIETGKGVEGDVPDLRANDILRQNLNPHLRSGDFYGGFDATLTALSSQIVSHRAEANAAPTTSQSAAPPSSGGCDVSGGAAGAGLIAILTGMAFFLVMRSRSNRRAEELRSIQRESQRMRQEQATAARLAADNQRKRDAAVATATKRDIQRNESVRRANQSLRDTHRSITHDAPKSSRPSPNQSVTVKASAAAVTAATVADQLRRQREADKARADRQEAERKRARDEERREEERRAERRRAREREEEESRSSSSSSSSFDFDWGGGSSGGSGGGFGGFGGGDSGGGGSSSDW